MEYSISLDWLTTTVTFNALQWNHAPERHFDAVLVVNRLHRIFINTANCGLDFKQFQKNPEHTVSRFYRYNFDNGKGYSLSLGYNDEQGCKVSCSGQFLDVYTPVHHILYNNIKNSNFKITRCDVAFDFFDTGISIEDLHKRYIEKHFLGKKKAYTFVKGKSGDTIYIGSRYSNYMLRIYDKGKQQKTSHDWIRFELEIKKGGAKALDADYDRMLRQMAGKIIKMTKELPDKIKEVFFKINGGETIPTVYNPAIKSDKEKYIHSFIAPYMEQAIKTDKHAVQEFLFHLHKKWVEEYNEPIF